MTVLERRSELGSECENVSLRRYRAFGNTMVLILGLLGTSVSVANAQTPLFAFAHISDAQPEDSADQARFESVLDAIVASGQPGALLPQPVSFVMFAGDSVQNATSQAEWINFKNTIDTRLTANGIPYRSVPGNHDRSGSIGFQNYETFIASTAVWETGSESVVGHNGVAVNTGWKGLDFIGLNNSNGGTNQVSSSDLSTIDLLATQASLRAENIFLLMHHDHDADGSIPLAQTLSNQDVVGYMRGYSGAVSVTSGLSGVSNPNIWDFNSRGIKSRGGIIYYEVFPTQILVYPIRLATNSSALPTPIIVPLVHPMVPSGPPVAPTADFSASPVTGSAPLVVWFADLSTGQPTSWSWDFGDGTGSTERQPSHAFAEGSYDVTLTVSNSEGSDVKEQLAFLNVFPPPPLVTFTAVADAHVRDSQPASNYGALSELRLRAGSTIYDDYLMFDVSGLGGSSVVSATLRLYVNDGSNDGGTLFDVGNNWTELGITWNNAPGGTAIGSLGSVVAGTWVEFDLSSQVTAEGIYSFALSSSSSNSAYYSSKEGAHPPELVVEIGMAAAPVAEFSATPLSGTAPLVVHFVDQSLSGPTSWQWDFGDGSGSTEQSPSHTYLSDSLYTVSLEVSNSAGNDVETKIDYVTVSPPVAPAAAFSADTTFGPAPLTVAFTDQSSGNPTSWSWDFGDGGGATAQSPSHTYTSPGLYSVALTVSNGAGNDALTRADHINVLTPPPISTFVPIADSKVKSTTANGNYGTEDNLRLRAGSTSYNSYLQFDVTNLAGSVESATLRLYVSDASDDGGTLFLVNDNSWTELGINFGNAPAIGSALGSAGATSVGQWVEFDVTSVVLGEGNLSFALTTTSSNSSFYDSREGTFPPELEVVTGNSTPTPDITVSPAWPDFGNVVLGESAGQVISLINDGTADLEVAGISLIGSDASEYSATGGDTPFTLVPGANQNIQVDFTPASLGTKSATLRITTDDPDEPMFDVDLDGTGAVLEPDITVTPSSLDYGAVVLGQSSSLSVTIRNDGTADLSIFDTVLSGAGGAFVIASGGGSSLLLAGTSQNLQVTFIPATLGPFSASLELTSDDPDQPLVSLSLSGIGSSVPPANVAIEEVETGGSSSSSTISTGDVVNGVDGHVYLASISSKPNAPVISVTGLGLVWTELQSQCGGRDQNGVSVWTATGNTSASDGTVLATLGSSVSNAALAVTRYSGVSGLTPISSANTNGLSGACSGGDGWQLVLVEPDHDSAQRRGLRNGGDAQQSPYG